MAQLEGPAQLGEQARAERVPTAEVVAALRRAGVGEVSDATIVRAEYSSDASLYRVPPAAVVWPRAVDEVVATREVCAQLGVPLTARGAGTSIAGNAIGRGVVLDVGRHLTRIHRVDPDGEPLPDGRRAGSAVVDPGVVHARLQQAAAPHGLRLGPDPSTSTRCTVGGMIGNNACGNRALAFGRTSDNVLELDVLTGSGERLRLGADTRPDGSPALAELHRVATGGLATIRTEFGRFGRQVSGYALEHLLPERHFDVRRMLVGSEGTLALVLGATIRLVPDRPARALVVLGYPDMASAADDVPAVLPHGPTALEGLDARIVDELRRRRGPSQVPPLPRGAGWLFVELLDDTAEAAAERAQRVLASASALDGRVVADPAHAQALWRIREDGAGLASRTVAGVPAYAGFEDAAVPPDRLGGYLRDFDVLLDQHGLSALPYGHFGDGCVHVRLDFAMDQPDGRERFRAFLGDAARLVASYGGSMSGEHGDGRARGELLPLMYSPAAIGLFRQVKRALDPAGLLNPGVLVDPAPVDADLRPPAALPLVSRPGRPLGFRYGTDGGDLARAVHRCTGVGSCVADTTARGSVMCPSYLATGREQDSTRGRARVLQEMVNGSLVTGGFAAPEVHEALDLCLSCKGCASDCPTGVDMATYKAEVLHQTYRRRLRPRSHYSLGQLPRWTHLASRAPALANAALAAPGLRRAALAAAGVDARRSLPRFAPQTFRAWFAGRPAPDLPADAPRVLLFVDTFTDAFSPEVGRAAVRVLEHAGQRVEVTPRPTCCGLTWITTGQLDGARRQLRRTVAALAPAARAGVPVVGLEPSCTAVLRSDAVELLGGADAEAVAGATRTLAEQLAATPGWTPPDLTGVTGVAQPHCHQHAVLGWAADAALLERAGADVRAVGGCCGLAGNFGVELGHYEVSVAVAEHDLLPAVRESSGVVLADGFSCRTQLTDLADRAGTHLAQLLADHLPG